MQKLDKHPRPLTYRHAKACRDQFSISIPHSTRNEVTYRSLIPETREKGFKDTIFEPTMLASTRYASVAIQLLPFTCYPCWCLEFWRATKIHKLFLHSSCNLTLLRGRRHRERKTNQIYELYRSAPARGEFSRKKEASAFEIRLKIRRTVSLQKATLKD